MDIWNEDSNELCLGMYFNYKNDVIYADRRWNISCNRELYVTDNKPSLWKAECKTTQPQKDSVPVIKTPLCRWRVIASKRRNHHVWRITTWTVTCMLSANHNMFMWHFPKLPQCGSCAMSTTSATWSSRSHRNQNND
ncbi:hypothetical protein R6Q59_009625 [Mikania micrantha]